MLRLDVPLFVLSAQDVLLFVLLFSKKSPNTHSGVMGRQYPNHHNQTSESVLLDRRVVCDLTNLVVLIIYLVFKVIEHFLSIFESWRLFFGVFQQLLCQRMGLTILFIVNQIVDQIVE